MLTGFVVGLACLPGLPRGYRWIVPLAISVPALLLLGDYVLVFETAGAGGTDLPGILYRPTIYMTVTVQSRSPSSRGSGWRPGYTRGSGKRLYGAPRKTESAASPAIKLGKTNPTTRSSVAAPIATWSMYGTSTRSGCSGASKNIAFTTAR